MTSAISRACHILLSISRIAAIFAAAGIAVGWAIDAFGSLPIPWWILGNPIILFVRVVLYFPGILDDIAPPGASHWPLLASNGLIYAVIGTLTWLGLHKHKAFLMIAALLLAGIEFAALLLLLAPFI